MGEGTCNGKGWDTEGCNGGVAQACSGVGVNDVVQHGQPEERVSKGQDKTCNDWGPVVDGTVGGESEPEKAERESPDGDQREQESCFWSWNTTVSDSVSLEQPGLYRLEEDDKGDTDNEVQVGALSSNVGQFVVVDKDVEDTVVVKE